MKSLLTAILFGWLMSMVLANMVLAAEPYTDMIPDRDFTGWGEKDITKWKLFRDAYVQSALDLSERIENLAPTHAIHASIMKDAGLTCSKNIGMEIVVERNKIFDWMANTYEIRKKTKPK
jgi:hypothetical protein